MEAHCRFRPCRNRCQNLLPAWPFRRERLDPTRLGGNGRAAPGRQLAGDVGIGDRVVGAQPDRPRDDPRRHGPRARTIRRRGRNGGARRLRHARNALRARLSAVLVHHAADQSAHRPVRRLAAKTACAIRWKSFTRVRAVWPAEKPISVRISANDWVGAEGIEPQDAVAISRMLQEAGVDICDVSAGQTSIGARPVYGRMFQTPFSDRIRNETGMATMAVGNIFEPDHINSILMAGRADLVCLARPHLADPYWTLHAAARLGDRGETWPLPYLAGRDQLYRLSGGADPAPTGCDDDEPLRQTGTGHGRRHRHRRRDRAGAGGSRREDCRSAAAATSRSRPPPRATAISTPSG